MDLTEKQHDATASALDACHRIGTYKALGNQIQCMRQPGNEWHLTCGRAP